MLATLQHKVVTMGLGLILFFLLGAVAIGFWAVVAMERGKARHRQEMENFVMGRGTDATSAPVADSQQFGGVAQEFTATAASPQPQQSDLVKELEAISRLGQKGKAKQAQEDAMVRRAERMHTKMIAEIERENHGPRTRPSGPCTLQITYVDADGVYTTRNVAPYKSGNTNEKFDAWCELRKDRRTFFFSRVQSGTHLRTGQRLSRAEIFKSIHPGRKIPIELL